MNKKKIVKRVDSGTKWEKMAGYCRAVRVDDRILVAGTTATDGEGALVGGDDPAAQTRFILQKIGAAIEEAGGSLQDVVRTRVFIKNVDQWEAVARVHGEVFGSIRPVNSLVQAHMIGEQFLVEIEAEAVIGAGAA